MHLQYNVRLAKGEHTNGVGAEDLHGAERDPVIASVGALALLAQRIADAGINIRLVSGQGIETGGSVVLSVGAGDDHEHHDHEHSGHDHLHVDGHRDGEQDNRGHRDEHGQHDEEALERLLDEYGYLWEPIIPTRTLLPDVVGALASWAREIADTGRLIDSIALGTPEQSGKGAGRIPLHATTIQVQTTADAPRQRDASRGQQSRASSPPARRAR